VYFDFLSRLFCGVGFKARQTNGSDLPSIHLATLVQLRFTFDKLPLSALPYGTICWLIGSEFTLSLTNKMLFLIGLLQSLVRISLIDAEIDNSMTRLEFEQNICILYLFYHVGEVYVLDLHDVALLL